MAPRSKHSPRRRRSQRPMLIIMIMFAAVGAAAALALTRSPILGLDLRGGLEVVLQAQAPKGQQITQADITRSIEIMRERIDKLGVAEPEIRAQGHDQIAIQLPGVHNSAQAASIIGQTAQLQFYDLEQDSRGASKPSNPGQQPTATKNLKSLLLPAAKLKDQANQWYLYKNKKLLAGPDPSQAQALKDASLRQLPKGASFFGVPTNRIILTCSTQDVSCPGVGLPQGVYYYLYNYQPEAANPIPEMTGSDLKLSGTRQDFDPQTGEPIVTLQFTSKGAGLFGKITKALAQRGQLLTAQYGQQAGQDILQHFAIVLDGEITSWPSIDFSQYPNGIVGSSAEITGLKNISEAKKLVLVLQTGALPLTFKQVERTDISATLGADSLHQALVASIGGLIAVAIFLLLFYRFLGLVAVCGLGFYGVLFYSAILLLNVTLTLPGFAGLILTIGVAADANVVIFERIKEEVRSGKSIKAAVKQGYEKGFHTIVDANVVTLITAVVLFAVATAGVKGFALMLIIGTLLSMVTAVWATRALLGMLAGFAWFDNPSFMGASATRESRWSHINFVGHWKAWFAISGAILAIGVGSLITQGLNLGIDFKGGSQINFNTPTPTSISSVRQKMVKLGHSDAVVQGAGKKSQNGDYRRFQIQTKSLSTSAQNNLQASLKTNFQAQALGVKNVSASFSNQILHGAIEAVIISLLLIVAYIAIRFQWQFAIPVLIALIHDIFITLGVYSLSGREVTASTVAAVLTILGYSIYDTIIVFDRVRENIPLFRRAPFAEIANRSLWETIRRSLATTFITLLPVSALLIFGGTTLKDFAFALAIGITSGAYSTIFIATPLLNLIKRREPDYARRGQGQISKTKEVKSSTAPYLEPTPEITAIPAIQSQLPKPKADQKAKREQRHNRRSRKKHGRR